MSMLRTRWAAIGAAVAVTLGAGGVGLVGATIDSGERPVFVPIEPCRLVDTRPADLVGPRATPLGDKETYKVTAHGANGQCNLSTDAVGLSLNVTAVDATLPTFLTIWPEGPLPKASSLNPVPGQAPTPNAVITDLSATGTFNIYNLQGTVHTIVDVNGYFADHNHDDRYVLTSSQMLPFAFGRVNADGTLGRHEGNVTTKWAGPLLRRYEIDVNPGVIEVGSYTNITLVTPADPNCADHKAVTNSDGGTEWVFLVDGMGGKVQCAFEFVIFRDRVVALPL